MSRILPIFIFMTGVFMLSFTRLNGQCGMNSTVTMQDATNGQPDTTQIIIQVEGAASNDLSTTGQGVCAVSLKFKHPFVRELSIELISPSGQKIALTGGQMSPANTPFITWDVTFIPCSATAAPDMGFNDVWENNQSWLSFKNYYGQYFPHNGCLEEFNIGPVNGNWTIRCIDFEDQGKGTLLDARIYFCEDAEITCSQCVLHPGTLPYLQIASCQGDPSLENIPATSFSPVQVKDSTHLFSYAFFRDSMYYTINDLSRMDTFGVGAYIVCPIEFDSISKSKIPPGSQKISLQSLKQRIIDQRYCAAISDSCLQVRISAAPDTFAIRQLICKNEEYQLFGQKFTEAGEYFVAKNLQACDSVVHLTLLRPENVVSITKDKPQLSCANDTLSLTVTSINPDYVLTGYNWSTVNGRIIYTKDSLLQVSTAGTYKALFTIYNQEQYCEDEVEIQVQAEGGNDTYFILPDSITCQKDTVVLKVNTLDNAASIRWSSPDAAGFMIDGNEIHVWQPGRFSMEIINGEGCVYRDTFALESKKDTIVPDLLTGNITCLTKSVRIQILNPEVLSAEFYGPGYFSNELSPEISKPGNYICKITSTNGCKSQASFSILADTLSPTISIQGNKTLTCVDTSLVLEVVSDMPVTTWMWSAANTGGPAISVNQPGEYTVFVTGINQCRSSSSVLVVEDKPVPQFAAEATTINCKNLLSKVSIDTLGKGAEIVWDNSLNPSSVLPGRFEFLTSIPGAYQFLLKNEQGCTAEGTVVVVSNKEAPTILQKIIDTLSCTNPAVILGVVLNQDGMEYIWNGPGVYDIMTDSLLTVVEEGTYFLKITGSNFCVTRTQFEVVRKGKVPVILLEADSLTCFIPQTSIRLQSTESLIQFDWSGPGGFQSSIESPIVSVPGIYTLTSISRDSCVATASIEVKGETDIPLIDLRDTFYLPCNLSGVLLSPELLDPELRYFWTTPDGQLIEQSVLKVFESGLYSLVGESKLGCRSATASTFVIQDRGNLFFEVRLDTITCTHPVATIAIASENPDQTYRWRSPSGAISSGKTFQSNSPGKYTLIVSDSRACIDSFQFFIPADTLKPLVVVKQTGQILCGNRKVLLEAISDPIVADLLYSWSTTGGMILGGSNQSMVQVEGVASYALSLENPSNGCKTVTNFSVSEVAGGLTTASIEITDPLCDNSPDGRILVDKLNGTPPYEIFFNGVKAQQNKVLWDQLPAGLYIIEIRDSLGCKIRDSIDLEAQFISDDEPFEVEMTIFFGDSVLLIPPGNAINKASLVWKGKNGTICNGCSQLWLQPFLNTLITVSSPSSLPCQVSGKFLIRVRNNIEQAIPNVFTPSGQSNNRFYIPQVRGIREVIFLHIFDRWAEHVFGVENVPPGLAEYGWDGLFDGRPVARGVYVVVAELLLEDGTTWKYRGDVTVLD